MKYPDFNIDAESPSGGSVRGKGGGSTPIKTPTPSNQNGNIRLIKRDQVTPGKWKAKNKIDGKLP